MIRGGGRRRSFFLYVEAAAFIVLKILEHCGFGMKRRQIQKPLYPADFFLLFLAEWDHLGFFLLRIKIGDFDSRHTKGEPWNSIMKDDALTWFRKRSLSPPPPNQPPSFKQKIYLILLDSSVY